MTGDQARPQDGSAPPGPQDGSAPPDPQDGSAPPDPLDRSGPPGPEAAPEQVAAIPPDPKAAPAGPRFLRVWASVELAIASVAVVLIFVSVLWQVFSRYVPAVSWPAIGELGNYSLIVLTFIMVGYLIGNNGHITIQIIDFVAKGRAIVVVRVVSALCTAVICAALVWEAAGLIQLYPARRTAALGIPLWLLYSVPLAGFVSGTVRAVVRVFTANREDVLFDTAAAR